VERRDRSVAIAARGLGEIAAELDQLVGEDRLEIERATGAVVADVWMRRAEQDGRELEELLEGSEEREFGGAAKLLRRGRRTRCRR
jgi:hypothetical protein